MNRKLVVSTLISSFAIITMGIAMPACPGQQEMKDQIAALQASNADLAKKVQAQEAKVKQVTEDLNTIRTALPQIVSTIQAQKTGMEQLEATLKEMQAKSAPKGAPKKKK